MHNTRGLATVYVTAVDSLLTTLRHICSCYKGAGYNGPNGLVFKLVQSLPEQQVFQNMPAEGELPSSTQLGFQLTTRNTSDADLVFNVCALLVLAMINCYH
eukprot:GHVR01067931.1.p1 GENE.GHVR01067931.1~~GHVR01067931.1.p1  ORF type:complete len:101 (-),score=5.21 GHVR01067931.1:58-360(-)